MNKARYLISVGSVVATIVLVTMSCGLNLSPVIIQLQAEAPGWTAPSGSLEVTCNATDRDGDPLSYNWSAEGGQISGTGPQVVWTAPQEVGMYDVTVVVDDGRGQKATGTLALIASNGPPPVIDSLVVTAEHKYLKETTTGYKVGKTQGYNITCVASGAGELDYQWSCTSGNMSGEGPAISWTAPDIEENVTVTVKVFDDAGNWVRKSVALEVVECSRCTFG